MVYDFLDGFLVRGVEFSSVHFYGGVEGGEFAFVGCEVGVVVVADVNCFGAVVGELMGRCSAYAEGGIRP